MQLGAELLLFHTEDALQGIIIIGLVPGTTLSFSHRADEMAQVTQSYR